MSLRSIHVVVILVSIATLLLFGINYLAAYRAWAGLSLALGTLLIPYLFWFLSKVRKAS